MAHWDDEQTLPHPENGEKRPLLSSGATETKFTAIEKRNIAFFIAGMIKVLHSITFQHLFGLLIANKHVLQFHLHKDNIIIV